MKNHRLGIKGMGDESAALLLGRVYAVATENNDTLIAFLRSACMDENVALICQSDPKKIFGPAAGGLPAIHETPDSRSLEIFTHTRLDLFAQRRGSSHLFTEEIEYFGIKPGTLIVIENAARFLDIDDPLVAKRQVELVKRLALKHNYAFLLHFADAYSGPMTWLNLTFLQDDFAGLVNIQSDADHMEWAIGHWFSTTGVVSDEMWALEVTSDGGFSATSLKADEEQRVAEPTSRKLDRNVIWIDVAALQGADECPEGWNMVHDRERLVEESEGAVASTAILAYRSSEEVIELAKLIFTLRKERGPLFKILVREISDVVRHLDEHLLLYVGANAMIPNDMSFARIPALVDSLKNSVFDKKINDTFDETLLIIQSEREIGYLNGERYIASVGEMVKLARRYHISYVIVRLALNEGVSFMDAMRVARFRRPGDVCTTDDNYVYLFLFGCRETAISTTVSNIFNHIDGSLFRDRERFLNYDSVTWELDDLTEKLSTDELYDYTDDVAALPFYSESNEDKSLDAARLASIGFIREGGLSAESEPLPVKKAVTG